MPNIFKVGDNIKLINPEINKLPWYQFFKDRKRYIWQLFKVSSVGSVWYDESIAHLRKSDRPLIINIINNTASETVLSSWIVKTSWNNDIDFYGKYL